MDNIFLQISILLALTVSIAFVVRLLKQPLIIAYIVAGVIAGPVFLNTQGAGLFDAFAQFGLILLLFVVGLSLNFDYIKRVGRVVFVAGTIQFIITAGVGFFVMKVLGFGLASSLFVAVALTFSSTIIVVKLLSDKKDLETVYGRFVIGLLLVQDVIAIIIMIFLNTSNTLQGVWYYSLFSTLGKVFLLVGLVFLMSRYVLTVIMDRIAESSELLFIFTIAWCFGVASLVYWSGFSMEIGAVVAGISLGASPYQRQISSRIRPLRDFFIVLFFIVLGSELQIGNLGPALIPGLVLSIFVLIADPLILYAVMRKMRYTRRNAFLAGITAAQISEFGFILAFKGKELGYLQDVEFAILTIVALVTFVVSSYLIEYNERIYRWLLPFFHIFGKDKEQQKDSRGETYPVWVFGYHRIGWKICEALKEKNIPFAVVDFNPEIISRLRSRNLPAYYGDAADVEFLDTLPLTKADLVISTIPEADDQITLVSHLRSLSRKPRIITNLYHARHLEDLYRAGADYVIMPHLLGGTWMSQILKEKPWTAYTFKKLRKEQKEEMKLRFTVGVQ
ncbi:MAG: cation:proton antiporter [Candidatus Magasanikbacteria bacterium]|nr:cation:proton antiporter [Candidatus Magasanikbacteria bacterium]